MIDNMFRTTDDKLFSTHKKALHHEVQLRTRYERDFVNLIDTDKLLRFIAENPRYVLDNYNPDNPEQVRNNGHVDVQVRELKKLEESRIKLFEFINEWIPGEKQNGILSPLLSVTNQIWRVANTRQW